MSTRKSFSKWFFVSHSSLGVGKLTSALDRRWEEEMKTKLIYTGAISMGIAAALAFLDLTMIKISLSAVSFSTMTIYPAAFFALLGLLLMYNGLRALWRKKLG